MLSVFSIIDIYLSIQGDFPMALFFFIFSFANRSCYDDINI